MKGNYTDNANVFKALADENRLKILELLLEGEKCGSELLEKVSMGQSTLSHHMKIMCVSGIIRSRKKGTATYYRINPDGAQNAVSLLASLTGAECPKKDEPAAAEETKPAEIKEEPSQKDEAAPVKQKGSRPNGWLL